MTTVLPVARIAGVEVRVHLSWVLVVAIVTLGLAVQLPLIYPEWSPALAWTTSIIVAVLVFGSVAAHELAHAIAANRRNVPTKEITLYLFGSAAPFGAEAEVHDPTKDAVIAAAGPVASLGLGAVAVAVWVATSLAVEPLAAAVATCAFLIGMFNLVVGLVNLVPGFPLDGGRIVRAAVWRATGSERRGTRAAATVGRAIGLIAILVGIVAALFVSTPEGMVTMLGGWLLTNSARVLDRQLTLQELTDGMTVADGMEVESLTVAGGLTLDTFAAEAIAETPGAAVRVAGDGTDAGRISGLIGNSQLRRVARRRWPELRARQVMTPLQDLLSVRPDDALWTALERLQRSRQDALPVFAEAEAGAGVGAGGAEQPIQGSDDVTQGARPAGPAPYVVGEGVPLIGLATRRSVAIAIRGAAERRGLLRTTRGRLPTIALPLFGRRGRGSEGSGDGPDGGPGRDE